MTNGHEAVRLPDGRIGYPSIVQYEDSQKRLCAAPPLDGLPFMLKIHDVVAYERLAATGALYSLEHTGKPSAAIDNRRTS